ncbi:MAG TPA: succinylglutamate-semialdehyde dehydrogenase [Sphingobium sp.]|uniref:succinylglutamate-semialdehyde dehydrogenase n=1 Tax=Sphingobium sp. TaxID=1912891 RepID=UPI002ED55D8D
MELISTDPCTGAEVWRGPMASAAAIDTAVSRARIAQPDWESGPLDDRIAIARAFAATVKADSARLAQCIAREVGKPLWEAETEVASVIAKVEISIAAQAERAGFRSTGKGTVTEELRHRAHGVLAVLGPYNFPAHLPNGHIVPALLAGNAVLFKPSELAPATAEIMARYWTTAGLPAGILQIVQGAGETGRTLASHEGIDGLLFTGSAPTGRALARQFVETPSRILALEMGGNNPLVLWDIADAELPAAAALTIQSAFLSAGQRCTCARRLIVEESLSARILPPIVDLARDIIVGAPFDEPQPFMGPVVDLRAAARVEAQYAALAISGGKPLIPLRRLDPDRPYLSPAIIDMTDAEEHGDDEIFGPVLQLYRVADFGAAIARANTTGYGLSASLIGGDEALFDRFSTTIRAGIINWNRPTNGASSGLPFGGIGESGNLRPSAYYAADYCAYPVATLRQSAIEGTLSTGLRSRA